MSKKVAIGIDLGGTKISGALFNLEGMIGEEEIGFIEGHSGTEVGKLMLKIVRKLQIKARERYLDIYGLGVAVPGIYYSGTGKVWAPNLPGWEAYPLLDQLEISLDSNRVAIHIESDRTCYILGELWRGAAQSHKNAIFLAVGTGIGAGILVDGQILRGSQDIGGAIGWMALNHNYKSEYGIYGCFEYHASGSGMARIVKQRLSEDKTLLTGQSDPNVDNLTMHDIFRAYRLKDPIAKKIIQDAVEYWGKACANLVSLFNPEIIIFGGGVFGPAQSLLPQIYAEAKKWAQPIAINQVRFTASQLGSDAGLFGAAYLAIK